MEIKKSNDDLGGLTLILTLILHEIRSDAALREYTIALKNQYMKKSPPISKVVYDNKIHVIHGALGT
ncbi:hypothetical protein P4C99_21770, partial [Pontiellaceae bacterium B1224]|nr:hypothetical protein [Pontiellaceae bacterium B1224]